MQTWASLGHWAEAGSAPVPPSVPQSLVWTRQEAELRTGLSQELWLPSHSEPSWKVVGVLGCWMGFLGSTEVSRILDEWGVMGSKGEGRSRVETEGRCRGGGGAQDLWLQWNSLSTCALPLPP